MEPRSGFLQTRQEIPELKQSIKGFNVFIIITIRKFDNEPQFRYNAMTAINEKKF